VKNDLLSNRSDEVRLFWYFQRSLSQAYRYFYYFDRILVFPKVIFWYMVGVRLHILILNTEVRKKTIQLNIESNNNFRLCNDNVLHVEAVYEVSQHDEIYLITYGRDLYYAFIDATSYMLH